MKREYRNTRWSVGALERWSARLISCIKAFRACIAAGPELCTNQN